MILNILIQLLAFFQGLRCFIFDPPDNLDDDPILDTNCGKIKGNWSRTDGAFSFRGIPFAEPPVGYLRWRPPILKRKGNNNCWSGTLNATKFGNICVQRDPSNETKVVGSEDCLFLNVYTPTLNMSTQLPVMFWIHGGSLTSGSGSEKDYTPTEKLAQTLNVVFVSVNYRLNAFGFLALEWLKDGTPTNTSGNYGLMDIVAGLHWVQENIKYFGGSPNEVTVFGQSSGGTAIIALLSSPLSRGLFHKAWMLSASPVMKQNRI